MRLPAPIQQKKHSPCGPAIGSRPPFCWLFSAASHLSNSEDGSLQVSRVDAQFKARPTLAGLLLPWLWGVNWSFVHVFNFKASAIADFLAYDPALRRGNRRSRELGRRLLPHACPGAAGTQKFGADCICLLPSAVSCLCWKVSRCGAAIRELSRIREGGPRGQPLGRPDRVVVGFTSCGTVGCVRLVIMSHGRVFARAGTSRSCGSASSPMCCASCSECAHGSTANCLPCTAAAAQLVRTR